MSKISQTTIFQFFQNYQSSRLSKISSFSHNSKIQHIFQNTTFFGNSKIPYVSMTCKGLVGMMQTRVRPTKFRIARIGNEYPVYHRLLEARISKSDFQASDAFHNLDSSKKIFFHNLIFDQKIFFHNLNVHQNIFFHN